MSDYLLAEEQPYDAGVPRTERVEDGGYVAIGGTPYCEKPLWERVIDAMLAGRLKMRGRP